MNLHEYQTKTILRDWDLPVMPGRLCSSAEEAWAAAEDLGVGIGGVECVVKAQVRAGGRGKAGGIKVARTPKETQQTANAMLGMKLITAQTGSAGVTVKKVYVEQCSRIAKEYYLSIVVNRSRKCPTLILSEDGGIEIEKTASEHPDRIIELDIDPLKGPEDHQLALALPKIGLEGGRLDEFIPIIKSLWGAFSENDFTLIEINPLALSVDGQFAVLDAKSSIDDNALFRRSEFAGLLDPDEADPREAEASKLGINYVGMDGEIGCMVNGAGLAMATMDIIKNHGGNPANFLDVGGGASKEMISGAFSILAADAKIKAILVNIFGGIMRCDVVASGLAEAACELKLRVPLVVRLQGTNVEQGKRILAESGLKIIAAEDLDGAARLAVEAAKRQEGTP